MNTAANPPPLRFGTRASALALAQSRLVVDRLASRHPRLAVELVKISTEGDRDKSSPLSVIGGRGVFTSALQAALLQGTVDAAVHSAKDLPSARPAGLLLVALLARDDPRDVLVSRHGVPLCDLPARPAIGTSSRRRAMQVRHVRPDAQIVELRGNIDTRFRKALDGDLDGIVVAAAGIERMGWLDRVTEFLPAGIFVPSPGQGALAVEIRAGEEGPAALLAELDEPRVSNAVRVERAFLAAMGGGCTAPVGALATVDGDEIELVAMLGADDGARAEWATERFPAIAGEARAADLARRMLAKLGQTIHANGNAQTRTNAPRPLAGRTVLVTRDADDDDPLVAGLAALGAGMVIAPTIVIRPVEETEEIERAADAVAGRAYDWLVFSSGNAVAPFLAAWRTLHPGQRLNDAVRVAAVGLATAKRLADHGVGVDLMPARFTAADLVAALRARGVGGQRVLFPKGSIARETIPDGLRDAGARVDAVVVYVTEPVERLDADVLARIAQFGIDIVAFMSPSSARSLARLARFDLASLRRSVVACIGPETAAAAAEAGFAVGVVPQEQTVDGLVSAIVQAIGRDRASNPAAFAVEPQDVVSDAARCLSEGANS